MADENYREIGLDVASARQRFLGNRELFKKFLFRFPEEQNFAKIIEAVETSLYQSSMKRFQRLQRDSGQSRCRKRRSLRCWKKYIRRLWNWLHP